MTPGTLDGNVRGVYVVPVSVGTQASVGANTSVERTLTVPGLRTTDVIVGISKPTLQAGLSVIPGRVSASDTLAMVYVNNTAAGITPTASETYQVTVIRPDVVGNYIPAI